jgi:hypothetical protein
MSQASPGCRRKNPRPLPKKKPDRREASCCARCQPANHEFGIGRSNRFPARHLRFCTVFAADLMETRAADSASSRRSPHVELAAGRFGIAQEGLRARQRLATFKSGDRSLAGAQAGSQFGLGETCRKRALSNSAAISNSGASASYSVLTLGLARRRVFNFSNGIVM